MSHHIFAALPATDGSLALSGEPRRLVLIEGGRDSRPAAPRDGRHRGELSSAQGARLVLCGLAVILAVALASAIVEPLRSGGSAAAIDALATESVVVSSGDTLWSIAQRCADDLPARDVVSWIQERNGIEGGLIVPGQRLVVPVG